MARLGRLQDRILTMRHRAEGKCMPATFDWNNIEEIGIQLSEKFPDTDPLSVRFTDLLKWIAALDGFTGDPKSSNEAKLEAVQMAWLEEYKDRNA